MTLTASARSQARVAFFLPDLTGGGIARVNINLANELARRGYPVDVVVVQDVGEFAGQLSPLVRVIKFSRERAHQTLWMLVRYLRAERPAVLFTVAPTLNIVAIVANALAIHATMVVPAEHMPVSVDRRENPDALLRFAYRLYPWFYRFVRAIVVNCEDAVQDFRREFPGLGDKVRLIHNPVVSATLTAMAKEPVQPGYFGEGARTRPTLIGAGRLTRQKNFPMLLRAFALVRQSRDCELVIVGGRGEDKEMLKSLAQELGVAEHVKWTGFVDNPYAYFSRATLFVLSSIYETLPTVLIEALACGIPAVATPCFGVAEILGHGAGGEVVADFEPATFAAAIVRALDRPADPALLRARAAAFSVEACAEGYAALVDDLADRNLSQARV